MTTPRPDPRIGTSLGPYRIEAVIGRGGMGVVYLAEQARLGRKVALKIVSPEFSDDPKARARFLRESQMAAAIDHPSILPVYEADEADGVLFIAMRLVEGTDLAARLRAGPMEPRAAAAILAQVASALDAAHARGLVHRDVKPANILLAPGAAADQGDHAYLTDFGLTKRGGSDSSLTAAGGFAGTLAYIAPEQVDGREVDGRADQYSLACMAFECLIGQVPFERETDIATAMAHLKDPPPSAVALRPDLPPEIDAVLARAMAKAPDDRYPTCSAFVADLREALGITGAGVVPTAEAAGPPGRPQRPWLWFGIGALAIATIVGVLASGVLASAPPASPSPSLAVSSPSAPAASASATATADVFPNAAEAAVLALLPEALSADCERGSYAVLDAGETSMASPVASLRCPLFFSTGANEVTVRRFPPPSSGSGASSGGASTDDLVVGLAARQRIIDGDCATTSRGLTRWTVAGNDQGAIACWTDGATGDAILYWSHLDDQILVRAVNQRGDPTALYDFFESTARFIAP